MVCCWQVEGDEAKSGLVVVFGRLGKKGYCWVYRVKFIRMVVEREGNQES